MAETDVLKAQLRYAPINPFPLDKVGRHRDICIELNKIYEKKNHDYGDSFHQTFVEEGLAMARIRLGDKFSRFKTLSHGTDQKVNDEPIEDTLLDLANYAIMTVLELRLEREGSQQCCCLTDEEMEMYSLRNLAIKQGEIIDGSKIPAGEVERIDGVD